MRTPAPSRPRRAAFTLIELMAVILIIGILAVALLPMVTDAIDNAQVTACNKNLNAIYQGTLQYQTKYHELPSESGARFFAQLYSREAMEPTKANAERLTCPAVDKGSLDIRGQPWDAWWSDLSRVDGGCSAYAGRDLRNHPLRKLSGKEPLVADDNDGGMNHATTTNVLYGNGDVITYELALLREEGVLAEDEILVVGPDSQVEDLRKLSLE